MRKICEGVGCGRGGGTGQLRAFWEEGTACAGQDLAEWCALGTSHTTGAEFLNVS